MVRIIAGTLIQVGKGKFNPEYVKEMLMQRTGLLQVRQHHRRDFTLMRIEYLNFDICNCDNLCLYF